MSDYKILHRRTCGSETWQVFYKGDVLKWYHPEVMEGTFPEDSNYHQLENAKGIIALHKQHLKRVVDQEKADLIEWVDEDGNPIRGSVYVAPVYEPLVTKQNVGIMLVVGVIVAIATYFLRTM
ncbi:hypothetical protein [Klebsiella phage DP]|nr:hypothetical protein [Klebsiella phage DP]